MLLAIDIEAGGGVMGMNPITQIGAAIIDAKTGLVTDKIEDPTFNVYIYNEDGLKFDKRCEEQFWMSKENIDHFHETMESIHDPSKSLAPKEAGDAFVKWARANLNQYKDVTVVTDTCGFDVGAFNHLIGRSGHEMIYLLNEPDDAEKVRYTPQENAHSFAKGVYQGRGIKRNADESTYHCAFRALGKEPPEVPYKKTHYPAEDAAFIGSIYAHLVKNCETE